MSANLDDDLDDYKLDSVFHTDPDYVLHTSFRRDLGRGLRKVKVEDKWYRERELGAGTFGSVYLEVTSDQRQRAVKQISKHLATRLGIDYKTELSALAMFAKAKHQQHQTLVELFGWYEDDVNIYLAMEYFSYGDLSKHDSRKWAKNDVKMIMTQLLEGLQIMHKKGFTHRDLKPQNIFVVQTTPSWWVKIGDFGITKRVKRDETDLRTRTGTQGYEAPEVLGYNVGDTDEDSGVYTNAVDIWSLGCVVYRLIAQELPFPNYRDVARFCFGQLAFPDGLKGRVDGEGIKIVKKMLTPEATCRPTAEELLKDPWLVVPADIPAPIPSAVISERMIPRSDRIAPVEANTRVAIKSEIASKLDILEGRKQGNDTSSSEKTVTPRRHTNSTSGLFGSVSKVLSSNDKIEKLSKATSDQYRSTELVAREQLERAFRLSDWGETTGDDEVSDITDKIGVLLAEFSDQEDNFAEKLPELLSTYSIIRKAQRAFEDSKARVDSLLSEITNLKSKIPNSPKIPKMTETLVRAETERMVREAEFKNKLRGPFRKGLQAEFAAAVERLEKQLVLAKHGCRLINLLSSKNVAPGDDIEKYDPAQARQILEDAEGDFGAWQLSPDLLKP